MTSSDSFAPGASPLPPAKIQALLDDLLPALAALHAEGRLHGAITPDAIEIDAMGSARLRPAMADPRRADPQRPLRAGLADGYAALEQYLDDPAHPPGPRTDLYALSAVVCAWIVGAPPTDAVARLVEDDWLPLSRRGLSGFPSDLLAAVDRGLALWPGDRIGSVEEFAAVLRPNDGLLVALAAGAAPAVQRQADEGDTAPPSVTATAPPPSAAPSGKPAAASQPAPPRRDRSPWPVILLVAALGLGLTWWLVGSSGPDIPRTSAANAQQDAATPAAANPGARSTSAEEATAEALAMLESKRDGPAVDSSGDPPSATGTGQTDTQANAAAAGVADEAPRQQGGDPAGTTADTAADAPASMADTASNAATATATGNEASTGTTDDTRSEPVTEATPEEPTEPAALVPVRLNIQPWGEVLIDGVPRGVSPPLKQLRLAPGTYAVTIRNADLPSRRIRLTVRAGQPASISHKF